MNKHDEALHQINYLKEIIKASKISCSPGYHFYLLWGFIWIAGYLGSAFFPQPAVHVCLWPVLALFGALLSVLICFRIARKSTTPAPYLLRCLGLQALILFLTF